VHFIVKNVAAAAAAAAAAADGDNAVMVTMAWCTGS